MPSPSDAGRATLAASLVLLPTATGAGGARGDLPGTRVDDLPDPSDRGRGPTRSGGRRPGPARQRGCGPDDRRQLGPAHVARDPRPVASAVASVAGLDLHEWGLWWEFHREEYLDLRGCLAGRALLDRDLATERLVGSLAAAEHGNVAAAAAVVLGRLSDPSAVPGLLEAVADPERPVVVREFTAAALGLIGESDLRSWRVELSSDLFSAAMTAKVHGGAGRGLLNIL